MVLGVPILKHFRVIYIFGVIRMGRKHLLGYLGKGDNFETGITAGWYSCLFLV